MTTDPTSTRATKPARRARRRFGCVIAVMLVVMAVLLAVGIGRGMWQSEPAYWTQNLRFLEQTPKAKLTDMADRAFNHVLGELSQSSGYRPIAPAGGGPPAEDAPRVRTIRLNFDEANAWLDQRLADWMQNQQWQMPPGISSPMISSHAGRLVIACRYESEEINQVFSVFLSLTILDDGQARLQIEGVRGGRLPMPIGMAMDQLPGAGADAGGGDGEDQSGMLAILLDGRPFDPILPIDGTRHARIIGLSVDDTAVSLTVQAEANGKDH